MEQNDGGRKTLGPSTTKPLVMDDLSDDILTRIFGFVLGPVRTQEHYINNGITVRHEHMLPTMVSNFDDIQCLPQVCKRWKTIVETSPTLWQKVHVSSSLLRIPRTVTAWMRVFFLLSTHSHKFESLHLTDESCFRDNTLDTLKLGGLAGITQNLKVIHFDHCFHRGANASLLSVLPMMGRLEQLQISSVNHDFISNVAALATMPNLKRIQMHGNGEYWDCDGSTLILAEEVLPRSLEVVSLANVKVMGAEGNLTPLGKLKILELIYIEWNGPFVDTISRVTSLEKLVVADCDKVVSERSGPPEMLWERLSNCKKLSEFQLSNGKYGNFCMNVGHDYSSVAELSNLEEVILCPEAFPPDPDSYGLGADMAGMSRLTTLHVVNFGLTKIPEAITGIQSLTELSLCGNKLTKFPTEPLQFEPHLRIIQLDNNRLREIPPCLGRFPKLQEIHIASNPLLFDKAMEFLLELPFLNLLSLGCAPSGRPSDMFPLASAIQVEDICRELKLDPVGAFHLGSICTGLRCKNPKFQVLL
ncbi:hypothetical protein BSKO_03298 [Bryopsis sp. KO-2023]|nr:hypothetical protein BSKO_03298 [Bryopsis sp. KO-2023]